MTGEAGPVPDDVRQAVARSGETHELKTWPEFFGAIETGAKTFEVRFDDRGMEVGDTLVLREWDPSVCCYTGKSLTVLVAYRLALADAPGLRWVGASGRAGEPGEWVVLGLSVPAVAEVFARDAKVREIVAESCVEDDAYDDVPVSYRFADCFDAVAALYPEAGK